MTDHSTSFDQYGNCWQSILSSLCCKALFDRTIDSTVCTEYGTEPISIIEPYCGIKVKKPHIGLNRTIQYKQVTQPVIDLDRRFEKLKYVYPAVLYDDTDTNTRYFYAVYTTTLGTDRQYMCAYPNCTQSSMNRSSRVHKLSDHPKFERPIKLFDCAYCADISFTYGQYRKHLKEEHSGVHVPRTRTDGTLVGEPPDNTDIPDTHTGQPAIPPDDYYNVYTTADIDIPAVPAQRGATPSIHVQRNARALIVVRIVKLDYWCPIQKSLIQWRPTQCRGKTRHTDCSCQHDSKCSYTAQCTCDKVHQSCVMYCNGYKLRWVLSSDLPYLAAIPIYRCDYCKCSGGAFTSNYEVAPDITLNIIPDITAHGGILGERVRYMNREFYIDLIARYSYHFNATNLSNEVCSKWSRTYQSRSIAYDADMQHYCNDPGIDEQESTGYYYGLHMQDHSRTDFNMIYRTELQQLCTNKALTAEYIADLFHNQYAKHELPNYMKLMYAIVYEHGVEHLIHDHTFKMTKSQHIYNPQGKHNKNVSTRLCVSAMLSTVMCLDTGLIIACEQVPSTKVSCVVDSLKPYIAYQRTLPPGTGKRIKSIGVDNARSQHRLMSMGLYDLLLPYNEVN